MASQSKEETETEGVYVEEPAQTEEAQEEQETPSNAEDEDWGKVALATDLSESVFKDGDLAVGGGGFGDVFKGKWVDRPSTTIAFMINKVSHHFYEKSVAIKVIRPLVADGHQRKTIKRVSSLHIQTCVFYYYFPTDQLHDNV
jgi:hypothetical protein